MIKTQLNSPNNNKQKKKIKSEINNKKNNQTKNNYRKHSNYMISYFKVKKMNRINQEVEEGNDVLIENINLCKI